MTRPYSEDLRERALARADAGETVRRSQRRFGSVPRAYRSGPSCSGRPEGVAPGKMGGHKKPVLSGAMRSGCASAFARGHSRCAGCRGAGGARDQDGHRAVWVFVHAEGLSFKKNAPAGRAGSPRRRPKRTRWKAHRARIDPRAWSSSTRPGSRPTWRRCAAGGHAASVSRHPCHTAIGRPDLPRRAAPRSHRRTLRHRRPDQRRALPALCRTGARSHPAPATSSSWTISAATRARPPATPSAPRVRISCSCRPIAPTSIRSSRSSPSSST